MFQFLTSRIQEQKDRSGRRQIRDRLLLRAKKQPLTCKSSDCNSIWNRHIQHWDWHEFSGRYFHDSTNGNLLFFLHGIGQFPSGDNFGSSPFRNWNVFGRRLHQQGPNGGDQYRRKSIRNCKSPIDVEFSIGRRRLGGDYLHVTWCSSLWRPISGTKWTFHPFHRMDAGRGNICVMIFT